MSRKRERHVGEAHGERARNLLVQLLLELLEVVTTRDVDIFVLYRLDRFLVHAGRPEEEDNEDLHGQQHEGEEVVRLPVHGARKRELLSGERD